MRKWNLPILILSAVLLWGCKVTGNTGNTQGSNPPASTFVARYVPTDQDRTFVPYPNDIYFAGSADGTLNVPRDSGPRFATTDRNLEFVNTLDGYSTTMTTRIPFTGEIDIGTVEPLNPLAPSPTANFIVVDFNAGVPLVPGLHYDVEVSGTVDTGGQILSFVPLMPLQPKNTYVFYVLAGITDTAGVPVAPDIQFQQIKDAWETGTSTGNGILDLLTAQAVGPLLDAAVNLLGLPPEAIMVAWSSSTQSITDVIEEAADDAVAQASVLVPTGLETNDIIPVLPGIADIYVGTVDTPYYMARTDPYGSIWLTAAGTQPNRFNPEPVPTETLTIPLFVTVPNALSQQSQPEEGWPVVIYMHGIGGDRTQATALADSMAAAGFVVVSIDHTLHGITDPDNPFFQGPGNESPLNIFGDNERNFFLDGFDNATGAPGPDGIIDNGLQVISTTVLNPINGRDNLRQTTADLFNLVETIPTMDLDSDGQPDFDGSRIHYVGLSWGALQGPLFLGVDDTVTTATLSSPGGTWTDLLTDPESLAFGQPILDLLASLGIVFGTDGFDTWARDWQNSLDPADNLTFAEAAAAMHPLHTIEVLGDFVVPNGPTDNFADVADQDSISSTTIAPQGEVLNGIVRFTSGGHGSLLDPTDDPAVTVEMQTQTVTFAATNGTVIPVDPDCNCVQ